jgi:hypothetical protein
VLRRWYVTSENIADLIHVAPDCKAEMASRYYDKGLSNLGYYLEVLFWQPEALYYKPQPDDSTRGRRFAELWAVWVYRARVVENPQDRLAKC